MTIKVQLPYPKAYMNMLFQILYILETRLLQLENKHVRLSDMIEFYMLKGSPFNNSFKLKSSILTPVYK